MSWNTKRLWTALFCLMASAGILMICSMNSWLYPLNPWNDANCFVTVGREMLRGSLPYRDLMEHKGPLLYALHALALWPDPCSYHGVWVVEVLLLAGTLVCLYEIARLYEPKANVGWMALAAAAVCASRAFRRGDSAEELCLLPMAWSMLALLRAWKTGKALRGRDYVLHGLLAGCILWTKFSLLGFHFVWMAFQAIETLIVERKPLRMLSMCLWFLMGMALASLPWLIGFAANGALDEMIDVYLYRNIFGYTAHEHGVLGYTVRGVLKGLRDVRLSVPLAVSAVGMLTLPREQMARREKVFMILAAAGMALTIYGGGRRYAYYFISFAVFLAFLPVAMTRAARKLEKCSARMRRFAPAAVSLALLVVSVAGAAAASPNARWIGYDYAKTAQGQAAALVGRDPGKTMLNIGTQDMGFYMALDARPAEKWFTKLNMQVDVCYAAQTECIREGRADYLITADKTLESIGEGEKYERVAAIRSEYPGPRTSYLYRKKD